jgi:hypothetical protein
MKSHHSAREVVIVHMTETPFAHHGLECVLIRVHANGFGQITITVGVARDQAP